MESSDTPGTSSSTNRDAWERVTAEGAAVLDKLRDIVHEGNVRRVVVQHEGRTVAEFPLTAGVVGVVLAPMLAAVGALIAMLQNCTVHIERAEPAMKTSEEPPRDTSAPVS